MSAADQAEYERLSALVDVLGNEIPPGVYDVERRDAFVRQLVESVRRVRYLKLVSERKSGPRSIDPADVAFDPLRALVHFRNAGDVDEAFWLAFIYVYFGKSRRGGWEYARRVYGALGAGQVWRWDAVRSNPTLFRDWLAANEAELRDGPGSFGNHRKYESLSATSDRGTGAVVESYVSWVDAYGSHDAMDQTKVATAQGDPFMAFELMVADVESNVVSFGRTASFDYANLLSWTDLAPVTAGKCHIAGSTGPRRGAQLLVGAGYSDDAYEQCLAKLCEQLDVAFDVMEDALCNWQKSPTEFKPFRG